MADEEIRQTRNRSPVHPSLSLPEAIKRAEQLYEAEGFNWTTPDVALSHWQYGPKNSAGLRTLAALIHFGLLEDKGISAERRVRLSDLSKRIIRDKRDESPDRDAAIRDAALRPAIYKKVWQKWGADERLPSRPTMEYQLEHDWDFNPNAVSSFIKDFLATVKFAHLDATRELSDERAVTDEARADKSLASAAERKQEEGSRVGQQERQPAVGRAFELPIPLISGGVAVLRMPLPLSTADYDLLLRTIQTTLPLMKPALVSDEPQRNVHD